MKKDKKRRPRNADTQKQSKKKKTPRPPPPAAALPVDRLIEAALAKKNPELHAAGAPAGYQLAGASTMVDGDGNVIAQWIKTKATAQKTHEILAAFRQAVEAEKIPAAKKIIRPKRFDDNLACIIPIGDMHMGMMAWAAETGEDWDHKLAREHNVNAIRRLIELAPETSECVIINLGDLLHADGYAGTTTAGTKVDVDTRWPKMLQVGIETMNEAAALAATKHRKVRVIHNMGNHDAHNAYMVALCQAAHFNSIPQIEVSTEPSKCHYFEFGKNLIGTTHGDGIKFDRLPGVMAVDQAAAWGRCTVARYWYLGHFHSQRVMETGGCTIETFRTLAPKDAWHTGAGYRSGRNLVLDVWHKEYGRAMRYEVSHDYLSRGTSKI